VFSADVRKAADARGRQLTKGGFLPAKWIGQGSSVVMRSVAVSLDLLPALPSAVALELLEAQSHPAYLSSTVTEATNGSSRSRITATLFGDPHALRTREYRERAGGEVARTLPDESNSQCDP
jgi:hypothetical protein